MPSSGGQYPHPSPISLSIYWHAAWWRCVPLILEICPMSLYNDNDNDDGSFGRITISSSFAPCPLLALHWSLGNVFNWIHVVLLESIYELSPTLYRESRTASIRYQIHSHSISLPVCHPTAFEALAGSPFIHSMATMLCSSSSSSLQWLWTCCCCCSSTVQWYNTQLDILGTG